MKLFDELKHTNGSTYIYFYETIGGRHLLARKSDGEITLASGLTQQSNGKIYWQNGTYLRNITDYLKDKFA